MNEFPKFTNDLEKDIVDNATWYEDWKDFFIDLQDMGLVVSGSKCFYDKNGIDRFNRLKSPKNFYQSYLIYAVTNNYVGSIPDLIETIDELTLRLLDTYTCYVKEINIVQRSSNLYHCKLIYLIVDTSKPMDVDFISRREDHFKNLEMARKITLGKYRLPEHFKSIDAVATKLMEPVKIKKPELGNFIFTVRKMGPHLLSVHLIDEKYKDHFLQIVKGILGLKNKAICDIFPYKISVIAETHIMISVKN